MRWFLSFYLELMAASLREKQQMVLLVDEPEYHFMPVHRRMY
ncbi:MAG: hypothetical protein R2744_03180 [Bacteroidales bacterium]